MYKFIVGDKANGVETSEQYMEAENYIEALEQLVADSNLYIEAKDEETENHINRVFKAINGK